MDKWYFWLIRKLEQTVATMSRLFLLHLLTSSHFPSDLVGFGAGRAGEETETEKQAGAGHRHNGPDQLRTIQHLRLLHSICLTSSLVSPRQQQNSNPQQYDRQTAQGLKQYTARWGEVGTAETGGPVYAYMCMCVFCAAPRRVWARVFVSDWDSGHFHKRIHGETCQLTAFDYCGCWCLWFAWFWF